jgi:hypothetical protein
MSKDNEFGSMLFRVLAGYGTLSALRDCGRDDKPDVYEHIARCQKAAEEDAKTHALLVAELGPDYLVH